MRTFLLAVVSFRQHPSVPVFNHNLSNRYSKMRSQKNFGIFWGQSAFFFIEARGQKIEKCEFVPFDTPLVKDGEKNDQELPEGLRYTALIQKTLTGKGISSKKVRLSLPAKDLIFRSFVIPWMEAQEVHNVVEFEAIKYIPIKLQELSYTYHPQPVTENNEKSFRILFVAIRKDVLGKYSGILEHSGLKIEYIEPAPVSMARLMQKSGQTASHHATAILEIGEEGGQIIIVEQGAVQFVREISLPPDLTNTAELVPALSNDIRVSFSFYTRQNPTGKIVKILLVTPLELEEVTKAFSKEFDLPAVMIPVTKLLSGQTHQHVGLLNALGIAQRDKTFSTKNFDLTEQSAQQMRKMRKEIDWKRFKVPAMIGAGCLLILLATYLFSSRLLKTQQTRLARIQSQQTTFKNQKEDDIEALADDITRQLDIYKSIRIKSDLIHIMRILPKQLPGGVWLTSMKITYKDPQIDQTRLNAATKSSKKNKKKAEPVSIPRATMTMELNGNVYLPDTNEQFRQPNLLLSALKESSELSEYFSNFDLLNIRQGSIGQYPIVFFSIRCQ